MLLKNEYKTVQDIILIPTSHRAAPSIKKYLCRIHVFVFYKMDIIIRSRQFLWSVKPVVTSSFMLQFNLLLLVTVKHSETSSIF